MRENFPNPAESSRRNEGTTKILEILISMKKEMEEREKKSGRDNIKSEKNAWKLILEGKNNNGNRTGNRQNKNGRKR